MHWRIKEEQPKIDEMAEVMPHNVVGPAPRVPGCPYIDETLDEEAPGDMPDMILSAAQLLDQWRARVLEPHWMA